MGIEKMPLSTEIPWNKIKEVHISSDGGSYGFEFEIAGRKQLMTVTVGNGQTSFTLSKLDGSPIVNATQKGRELRVLDFSKKLQLKKASALKGVKISRKHN